MRQLYNVTSEQIKFPRMGLSLFVFTFFFTMKISFLLNINEYFILGLLVIFLSIFSLSRPNYFSISYKTKISMFLFYIGALLYIRGNLNAYIEITLLVIPFILFVALKDVFKFQILQSFDKLLSITVALSLFAWILFLLGVPLPHYDFDWNSYNFDNYYFFLKQRDIISFYSFPRFQYVFTEPGYFACLCSFMMYLRRYSFKDWQTIVYLIAVVMTYSLAGYVFLFLGLFVYMMQQKTGRIKYALFFISLILLFLVLLTSDNENVISSMFAYRLEYSGNSFSGNNRTSESFNVWWNTYFVHYGDWFWGENDLVNNYFAGDNLVGVDLRAFTARYGVIPLLFYFGSMIYYYFSKPSRLGLFFLLLFLLFYYRGYTVMFYMGFPMLYVTGICLFNKKLCKL